MSTLKKLVEVTQNVEGLAGVSEAIVEVEYEACYVGSAGNVTPVCDNRTVCVFCGCKI